MTSATDTPLSHAGGVAYRTDSGAPRFLVVQASRNPTQWVLPKGHIEPGENPEETAVREIREEAGVDAEVLRPVGDISFVTPREPVHARFYLMRRRGDAPADENRSVAWLPYEEARDRLTFEDQRGLLARANDLLAPDVRSR